MNTLLHRAAAMRLGIACAALLAASAVAAHAEDLTKSFTVSGRANVRVETNDGSVRVTTGDAKQVEFRVEYRGYELGKNLRVDAHQEGDKVELTARVTGHWGFSFGHNSRGLHIEVRMPREADLQVETGDGSVQAESINGTVNVHTGDGSVKAYSLNGTIDLHTNDGSITVENLKGDMRLRTGDGSIEARSRWQGGGRLGRWSYPHRRPFRCPQRQDGRWQRGHARSARFQDGFELDDSNR